MLICQKDRLQSLDVKQLEMKEGKQVKQFDGKVIKMPGFKVEAYPYVMVHIDKEYQVIDVNMEQTIAKIKGIGKAKVLTSSDKYLITINQDKI